MCRLLASLRLFSYDLELRLPRLYVRILSYFFMFLSLSLALIRVYMSSNNILCHNNITYRSAFHVCLIVCLFMTKVEIFVYETSRSRTDFNSSMYTLYGQWQRNIPLVKFKCLIRRILPLHQAECTDRYRYMLDDGQQFIWWQIFVESINDAADSS